MDIGFGGADGLCWPPTGERAKAQETKKEKK